MSNYPTKPVQVPNLVGKVIVFNEAVEICEIDYDVGMKARVTGYRVLDDDVFKLDTDFSEFMEHNVKLMKSNYYDDHGMPTLRWDQTPRFPKNGKTSNYFGFWGEGSNCFDIEA